MNYTEFASKAEQLLLRHYSMTIEHFQDGLPVNQMVDLEAEMRKYLVIGMMAEKMFKLIEEGRNNEA